MRSRIEELRQAGYGSNSGNAPHPVVLYPRVSGDRPLPNELQLRPLGFPDQAAYAAFVRNGYQQLEESGYPQAVMILRGSAATGERWETGRAFGDENDSDIDLAIVSPALFSRLRFLFPGKVMNNGRSFPLELNDAEARLLGLNQILLDLHRTVNLQTSVVIYKGFDPLIARGSFIIME